MNINLQFPDVGEVMLHSGVQVMVIGNIRPVEPNVVDLATAAEFLACAIKALGANNAPESDMVREPISWAMSILQAMAISPLSGQGSISLVSELVEA